MSVQLEPDHPDTAQSLNSLAVLYYEQGAKYDQAEPLLQRALATPASKLLGLPDHPDTAQSLNSLAMLYHKQAIYENSPNRCHSALLLSVNSTWDLTTPTPLKVSPQQLSCTLLRAG